MIPSESAVCFLRAPQVLARRARSRSQLFRDIEFGVFPPGVRLGARCTAWPSAKVDQVLSAEIGGATTEELRELVATARLWNTREAPIDRRFDQEAGRA
jgi:prophage regulatory protein